MKFQVSINQQLYEFDTQDAISIAIKLDFDGQQPNHFGAETASKIPLQAGEFIGDTKRGGSCNVDSISLVPHCNGTHTESIAHIIHQQHAIGQNIANSLCIAKLISVTTQAGNKTTDNYLPELQSSDKVITLSCLQKHLNDEDLNSIEALIIRTLPNTASKLSCIYQQNHQPPFFTHQAISWLANSGIKHLLVDMPSIDKMYDDGQLSNHHIYWHVQADSRLINANSKLDRTITEMIYVDNTIKDGWYCLNLQIPAFLTDAAPSRPLLYPLTQIKL